MRSSKKILFSFIQIIALSINAIHSRPLNEQIDENSKSENDVSLSDIDANKVMEKNSDEGKMSHLLDDIQSRISSLQKELGKALNSASENDALADKKRKKRETKMDDDEKPKALNLLTEKLDEVSNYVDDVKSFLEKKVGNQKKTSSEDDMEMPEDEEVKSEKNTNIDKALDGESIEEKEGNKNPEGLAVKGHKKKKKSSMDEKNSTSNSGEDKNDKTVNDSENEEPAKKKHKNKKHKSKKHKNKDKPKDKKSNNSDEKMDKNDEKTEKTKMEKMVDDEPSGEAVKGNIKTGDDEEDEIQEIKSGPQSAAVKLADSNMEDENEDESINDKSKSDYFSSSSYEQLQTDENSYSESSSSSQESMPTNEAVREMDERDNYEYDYSEEESSSS